MFSVLLSIYQSLEVITIAYSPMIRQNYTYTVQKIRLLYYQSGCWRRVYDNDPALRLSTLMSIYFHTLYILVIKISSSVRVSSASIIIYISYSISTTKSSPTCYLL
jgi:hypothetical protein